MATKTFDKPITTLSHKTLDDAGEAVSIIELRMFGTNNYEAIEDFEEAVTGHRMDTMTDQVLKKYAKWLISDVQGTNEGMFSDVEFSG